MEYVYRNTGRAGEPAGWYAETDGGYELVLEAPAHVAPYGRVGFTVSRPFAQGSHDHSLALRRALRRDCAEREGVDPRDVRLRAAGRLLVECWVE